MTGSGSELVELSRPDGRLVVGVAPHLGAELVSLVLRREGGDRELLYRGGDLSATEGWSGRAPILWPATGRNYPPDQPAPTPETFRETPMGWTHGGVTYPLRIHGFARDLPWRLERFSEDSADLVLEDGPETREAYPFGFRFALGYRLGDRSLTLSHTVTAASDNLGSMPFAIGNHITFRLPLLPEGDPGLTTIHSPAQRELDMDATGRPTGRNRPGRFDRATPLSDLEPLAVYALAGYPSGAPEATLRDPSGLTIRLAHEADRLPDGDPVLFNLWGDLSQGFFSPEPWVGKQNALASGNGVVSLAPGEAFHWTLTLAVEEDR